MIRDKVKSKMNFFNDYFAGLINNLLPIKFIIFSFIWNLSFSCFAFKFDHEICKNYQLGANWYCDNKEESEDASNNITPEMIMEQKISPVEKALLLNQLWEVQTKKAVITGNSKDLEDLLRTQKFIAQKGGDFARKMTHLIEAHPEYSNSSSYYKNITDEYQEQILKDELFKQAKDTHSLAMVYSADCWYCQRQIPIILALKEQLGFKLIGVSVDGNFYEGFDANIFDSKVLEDENIRAYPTILLINNQTYQRAFVAKGLTTKDDLEKRIYRILKDEKNESVSN